MICYSELISRFCSFALAVAGLGLGGVCAQLVPANFIEPGGSTPLRVSPPADPPVTLDWPLVDWTRGNPNTTYAAWDTFGSCGPLCQGGPVAPDQPPDAGSFGFDQPNAATATVLTSTAFYTSSNNVYSFADPTDWEITMPAPEGPDGSTYYFVAQTNTLGNQIDLGDDSEPSSVVLSYDDGEQFLQATGILQTQFGPSGSSMGGAGVSTLFWWEITGEAPEIFLLEFNAAGTSMSLTDLVIDVFAAVAPPTVAGDYDSSGSVGSSDHNVWVAGFGSNDAAADGNGDGAITAADYVVWRDNVVGPVAAAVVSLQIPEPNTSAAIAAATAIGLLSLRQRRSASH